MVRLPARPSHRARRARANAPAIEESSVIMCWSRAFLAHRFLRFLRDGKCFRMHGHSVQTGTGPWLFSASHIRILRAARNKGAQSERESQRQRKTDRQTGRQRETEGERCIHTYRYAYIHIPNCIIDIYTKEEKGTSAAPAPARPRPGRLQALLGVVLVGSDHALLWGLGFRSP